LRGKLKVNNAGDSWPTNFKLGSEYILKFPEARKKDYPSYDGDTGLFKYTVEYIIPINNNEITNESENDNTITGTPIDNILD
jgi:hypothetical protein